MGCSVIQNSTEWHAGSGLPDHPSTFLPALAELPSVGQVGWQQPSPVSLQVYSTVTLITLAHDWASVRTEPLLIGLAARSLTWLEGNVDCIGKVMAELFSYRSLKSRQWQWNVIDWILLIAVLRWRLQNPALPYCTSSCCVHDITLWLNVRPYQPLVSELWDWM